MAKPALPDPNPEDALRRKVADGSASLEDYAKLGGLLFLMGNSQEAVTLYRQAIDLALTNLHKARVCIELGSVHSEMGQQGEAHALGQQALGFLTTEADSLEVLACRGGCQTLLAQLEWAKDAEAGRLASRLALENLERTINEGTEFEGKAVACFDAAVLHSALGSTDRAITLCERYLGYPLHEWERISGLTVLADALRQSEQFDKAQRTLYEAIQFAGRYNTTLANLYLNLGLAQRLSGSLTKPEHLTQAQHNFQQALLALEADPYRQYKSELYSDIYMNLAAVCYELGNFKGAAAAFDEVLQSATKNHTHLCEAQFWLGRCHQAEGSHKQAQYCFEKVLVSSYSSKDQKVGAQEGLARSLYELREYGKASEIFKKLSLSYPQEDSRQASTSLLLGYCHEGLRDHRGARECYEEVLALPHALEADKTSAREGLRRLPPTLRATSH